MSVAFGVGLWHVSNDLGGADATRLKSVMLHLPHSRALGGPLGKNLTPLNPKNLLRRELRPACIRLELPLITWHSFRHTQRCSVRSANRCELRRRFSATRTLKTTLNYTHAIPELQRRAVDKVAEVMFPNVPKFEGGIENGKVNWLMLKELQ